MNKEARALFSTLEHLLPTAHQLQSFRALIAAFLSAEGNPRPARAPAKSPAALSRFLNRYRWNTRAVIRTVRRAILVRVEAAARQRRGRKPVLEVSVDATCLEKTGAFEGLENHRLNDKLGLHLVVLYVVLGHQRFPWSFAVWRGKGSKSPARLALSMLARLPQAWSGWFEVRVLADAGFGSSEFIQGVHRLGFQAVVGVSSDRKTTDGRAVSELRCRGVRVRLRGCKVPVSVSWFKLRRDRGEFVWRYAVSTQPATGETIKRWGRRRWRIEAFFKTMKSRFGLDQFGQRTARGALRFLVLALVAYLLAWWTALALGDSQEPDWGEAARTARDGMVTRLMLAEARAEVERLEKLLLDQESENTC